MLLTLLADTAKRISIEMDNNSCGVLIVALMTIVAIAAMKFWRDIEIAKSEGGYWKERGDFLWSVVTNKEAKK